MISVEELHFRYGAGTFELRVDKLAIRAGEAVALVGPSGSGKTTLLNLISGILEPLSGRVRVGETEVSAVSDADRRAFRIAEIGFIFQDFALLDYLDARDNILLPYRIHPALRLDGAARREADQLGERLGLTGKLRQRPRTLSQGEKQRVAIARALITRPHLLLADEPTSSLDAANARATLDLIFELVRERSTTLLMLTHDPSLLPRFDRVVELPALAAGEASAAGGD